MKKIIFNGRLACEEGIFDLPTFIEISICSYGYKKDGEKISLPYVVGIADDDGHDVDMSVIKKSVDLVNFVKAYGFNKADTEKLIKGIKRNGADFVMLYGAKELSTMIKALKQYAEKQNQNKYLKEGEDCLNYGEDCLNDEAKRIILSDKEFNDGIHSDGVANDAIARLAKQLGFFEDGEDFAAFEQNLAIIAINETGKHWWVSDGLSLWEE